MKVLFQSHEFAKRSASRFEDAGLDWPLHRRLLALALMFGHDSWESLVATCADGNPKVIFDQDMSQDAFAKRSADMAHGLSIGLDLIYQEAYDIVSFVRPLHDRARPSLPLYVHDEHRAKYQAEEGDTWYVSTQETWHPFTIPGFEMCLSTNLSAMARGRLKKRDLGILWKMPSESPMFRRAVLVPHGFKKPWTQQAVFRVGELMAFEEQPMRWMLRAPSSHPPQVNEWLARGGLQQHPQVRALLARVWPAALFLLPDLASCDAAGEADAVARLLLLRELGHMLQTSDTNAAAIDLEPLHEQLARFASRVDVAPGVCGASSALLFLAGRWGESELADVVAQRFGPGADSHSAMRFLTGLMAAAPGLLLRLPMLLGHLDGLVRGWDADAFMARLPDLRQMFTRLKPKETADLATAVGQLHATAEGAADLVAMHYETSEQDLLVGLQLEQALAATLERDGLNGWRM